MTSDFDHLMTIMQKAIEDSKFFPIANWLADICIAQADTKKEGWTFEGWKKSDHLYAKIYKDNEFLLKMHYLNQCHNVLDHSDWHLKVFTPETANLIKVVDDAIDGKELYEINKLKRDFPQLLEHLKQLSFKPIDKKGWMWSKT